jgi:hypothetical protein
MRNEIPNLGSDTISELDLSSRLARIEASFAVTFPSTIADILSNASAVFSNFENVFSRRLNRQSRSNCKFPKGRNEGGKEYMEVAFSTEARSVASDFLFFRALSFALKIAYPAAVSARMKTIVSSIPKHPWSGWTWTDQRRENSILKEGKFETH